MVRYDIHYLSAHLFCLSPLPFLPLDFTHYRFMQRCFIMLIEPPFSAQNSFSLLTFSLYIHLYHLFFFPLVFALSFSLCESPLLTLLLPLWSTFFSLSHYLATALVTLIAWCSRCTGGGPHQGPVLIHQVRCRAGMPADTTHSVFRLINTFRKPPSDKNADKKCYGD